MTVRDTLNQAETALSAIGIGSARLDTELLLAHVLGKPRAYALAHPEYPLTSDEARAFQALLTKRAQRIPLVHLTHQREFYGMNFYIDDQVLTPRVETERMVDFALKHAPKNSALIDIGTGSGAIALALARHRPDLAITATEVSATALAVAARNALQLGLNTKFVQSDLFKSIEGVFQTVVTNLPYLTTSADLMPEVRREPAVALFGGDGDGLELYRRFLTQLPAHLAPGGFLFTECDPWQQADLIAAADEIGLSPIEQDYFILGFVYDQSPNRS